MAAPVDDNDARAGDLLNSAISNGDYEQTLVLLNQGVSVAQKDFIGQLPMFVAARDGRENIVALLIERGVDVNSPARDGRGPLYYAASKGHSGVVRLLLRNGAVADAIDRHGQTPLLTASCILSSESLNVSDLRLWRMQQECSTDGLAAVVEALILAGANVHFSRNGAHTSNHFIRQTKIDRLITLVDRQPPLVRKRSFWVALFGRN
ncbi:ankyrin repeat domain-containing protein [Mesorhizobium sp. B2-3-3]|nr:ankyrin repeat domain-containing protein [Mesorhizobium sp. B2-3-3]